MELLNTGSVGEPCPLSGPSGDLDVGDLGDLDPDLVGLPLVGEERVGVRVGEVLGGDPLVGETFGPGDVGVL